MLMEQKVAGDREQLKAACKAAVQLSAAVLEQLLPDCRSLLDFGGTRDPSTGSAGNSRNNTGRSSSSSGSILLQSCDFAAFVLADACTAGAMLETGLGHIAASVQTLYAGPAIPVASPAPACPAYPVLQAVAGLPAPVGSSSCP